jgi:uncharacterized membrane protein YfcA
MPAFSIMVCLGIGSVAGVIAALCGVGGGVVMVPCFVSLLGLDQKQAVATSLMAMIGTALVTSVHTQRNGLGDWKLALWTTLGSMVVAWFAAGWLKSMSNERLTQFFGIFLLIMGVKMVFFTKV